MGIKGRYRHRKNVNIASLQLTSYSKGEILKGLPLRLGYIQCNLYQNSNGTFHRNRKKYNIKVSVPFSSMAQSCPTLCDPMNPSTPSIPVPHQLLEFTQTHVHCVGDAIQPSPTPSSPSPPAFSLYQHQGLFK